MNRLSLEQRMMLVAVSTSFGSTCTRRRVGCVLTDAANKVCGTGFNGSPRGMKHCIDVGCTIYFGHCVQCVHAELNACLQCEGDAVAAWCTDQPCVTCLRALLNKGVKTIHWWREYVDQARDAFTQQNDVWSGSEDHQDLGVGLRRVSVPLEILLTDYYELLEKQCTA